MPKKIDPSKILATHATLFSENGERAVELARAYGDALARLEAVVADVEADKRLKPSERTDVILQLSRHLPTRLSPKVGGEKELPDVPPVAYRSYKNAVEGGFAPNLNPVEFTRKVYASWIGEGLTRKDLNEIDPDLYKALAVWEHRHPEQRIHELPTATQVIDEKIALLSAEMSEEELRKLGSAIQSRHRRKKAQPNEK